MNRDLAVLSSFCAFKGTL